MQACCNYNILVSETDGCGPRAPTGIAGTIDKASPVPFYYQLRQLLESAVAGGVLDGR